MGSFEVPMPRKLEQEIGAIGAASLVVPMSLTEKLTEERNRLQRRVEELDKALKILAKFTEIQEVMDVLSKLY